MKKGNESTIKGELSFVLAAKKKLSAEELFQLAEQSYANGSPWSRASFEQDLNYPHAEYLIATTNKELIGFIGYHQILDEIEIMNVVVSKHFQQQGIASQMMKRTLDKLAAEQVSQVFLEVRKSNQAAVKLYQKHQFVVIGERKNYYAVPQEDALIMQMKIKQKNA